MILNYSMESLLSLSICLDFLKPVCGLVLLFYFVLSKVPIRYNGRQKACGQPRVWHVFGSNRSDREGIPSPPCPSWGAPGQSRPVQLLSRQPPPVLQPRGSASRMSWRENQHRQPVEAGPFQPHSPLEVPPPGVSTVFCSGPRRVLSVGDPTARILSWSVLRSYRPAASSAEPRAPAKRRLDRFPCLAANRVSH